MSVYTLVTEDQLIEFLRHYALGELQDFQGISAGIENTNYFVTTSQGRFVLTLFEQLSREELPYFLNLTAHLAEHEVASAHPVADNDGAYLRELNGKPAALVQRLSGHDVKTPTQAQCRALGQQLGHLHVVGQSFKQQRANDRGPHWWRETTNRVLSHLTAGETDLLRTELAFQSANQHLNLPRGVIHADLFRDNALFEGDQLSGIIDFYYACNDVLLYDVAVTANDWCSQPGGKLEPVRLHALLDGYRQERAFTTEEQRAWPVMLRAAALRFWLSRLQDLHFPRPGELTHIKDPNVFKMILEQRRELPKDCHL